MPSPSRGLPVTGVVAAGTFVTVEVTGDSTAKSGSVSKLTDSWPAADVESGSMTKVVPFHTSTALAAVIPGEAKLAVTGLRNVPGYGAPLSVIRIPAPVTSLKPRSGAILARSGAVTVSCAAAGKAPAGMAMVRWTPPTSTGLMVPPAGPMVTLVTTVVKPPGGTVTGRAGGPYAPGDAVAAKAPPPVPKATAAPIIAITDSFKKTTLSSLTKAWRVHFDGMSPPSRRSRWAKTA